MGLLLLPVVVSFTQSLEDPGVYNDAISDTDVYTRVCDELLSGDSRREETGNLPGGVDIAVQGELPQATGIPGGQREELRRTFIEGDTRAFLKAVADPLVQPLIMDDRRYGRSGTIGTSKPGPGPPRYDGSGQWPGEDCRPGPGDTGLPAAGSAPLPPAAGVAGLDGRGASGGRRRCLGGVGCDQLRFHPQHNRTDISTGLLATGVIVEL